MGSFNSNPETKQHVCHLDKGEYIREVITYESIQWGYTIQGAVKLITNKKTCGPYGKTSSSTVLEFGYGRLLYISGSYGYWLDRLDFVFDVCTQ